MVEQFGVTPGELRAISGDLHGYSAAMQGVMSALRAQLSGEGAAWGDDEIGEGFANGPGGYLAQSQWVEGSGDAKANLLEDYAERLRQAADVFERADEG